MPKKLDAGGGGAFDQEPLVTEEGGHTASGEVLGKTANRHTSAEFVVFLQEVVASVEAARVKSTSLPPISRPTKPKPSKLFCASTRTSIFVFTPPYSSWLNQVEIWFSKIQRDIIARGVFESRADLARKIMRSIRHYNQSGGPFPMELPEYRQAKTMNRSLLSVHCTRV